MFWCHLYVIFSLQYVPRRPAFYGLGAYLCREFVLVPYTTVAGACTSCAYIFLLRTDKMCRTCTYAAMRKCCHLVHGATVDLLLHHHIHAFLLRAGSNVGSSLPRTCLLPAHHRLFEFASMCRYQNTPPVACTWHFDRMFASFETRVHQHGGHRRCGWHRRRDTFRPSSLYNHTSLAFYTWCNTNRHAYVTGHNCTSMVGLYSWKIPRSSRRYVVWRRKQWRKIAVGRPNGTPQWSTFTDGGKSLAEGTGLINSKPCERANARECYDG